MTSLSLNSCFKCIKYSMFVFCLICWLLGLITFIYGIVARVTGSYGPLDQHIPSIQTGANLLIAVGFIIMLVGFLGCCGTIRESQCMLISFFLVIFLSFTLLMAAGLWAVAWRGKFNMFLYKQLEEFVDKYDENNKNNDATNMMNYLQSKFDCCGVNSAADYTFKPVPRSCNANPGVYNAQPGCHQSLLDFGLANLRKITGIGIGFAVLLISGMVFSMMLCCALREVN